MAAGEAHVVTTGRTIKRKVRARMRLTGETYVQALRVLLTQIPGGGGVEIPDLARVGFNELPSLEGDPALEPLLQRLLRQHQLPQEAVSGFSSAI